MGNGQYAPLSNSFVWRTWPVAAFNFSTDAGTGVKLRQGHAAPPVNALPTRDRSVANANALTALTTKLEFAQIPVIVATTADERGLAETLGATSYLSKPASAEELRAAIRGAHQAAGERA